MEFAARTDTTAKTAHLPQLPAEIWAQIASEVLCLGEPIWEPWHRYRSISRTFKRVIEEFYLAEVVKGMRIYANYKPEFDPDLEILEYYAEYWFAGFDDEEREMAVLRLNDERCTSRQLNDWKNDSGPGLGKRVVNQLQNDLERCIDDLHEERGYNYCLIMSLGLRETVGQGYTDMLPMDLRYPSEVGSQKFVFDWRRYLCAVFAEMNYIDMNERLGHAFHVPQLASELLEKYPSFDTSLDGFSPETMKALIDASKTTAIGVDGRLLRIREQRRRVIGERAGLYPSGRPNSQRDAVNKQRFMKQDAFHVGRQLLNYQETAALEGKLWKL